MVKRSHWVGGGVVEGRGRKSESVVLEEEDKVVKEKRRRKI